MAKAPKTQSAQVVPLRQNTIYPTYQLYAQMGSGKTTTSNGLRLAALITLHWVKERLGETEVAELSALPAIEDYAEVEDSCLESFHVSRGFLIEVVALPEKGLWSLHITEPDMGFRSGNFDQDRQAVPGRIIETNVAYRIVGTTLHCGFQTRVSDPEEVSTPAEVYRLAIIRRLIDHPDFGLRQITPLTAEVKTIANKEQFKDFQDLCTSPDNQLPNVVFTREDQSEPAPKPLPAMRGYVTEMLLSFPDTWPIPPEPSEPERQLAYDQAAFARHTTGYCRSYDLDESLTEKLAQKFQAKFKPGDILVIEPKCFGGACTVYQRKNSQQRMDEQLEQLWKTMYTYPRGKAVTFGPVSFLAAAQEALRQSTQDILTRSAELSQEWKRRLADMKKQWEGALQAKEKECEELRDKLKRQGEYTAELYRKIDELNRRRDEEQGAWEVIREKQEEVIAQLRRKLSQPSALRDIPAWVETQFSDRLLLLPSAVEMLQDKSLQADVGLICDALDFLSTDYWASRYEQISDEEMWTRCSWKYQRPFEIKPIGEETVKRFPREYKAKYTFYGEDCRREVPFDTHLRVGNDAEKLLRIYFFHDDGKQLVVVGSLPRHLSTINC